METTLTCPYSYLSTVDAYQLVKDETFEEQLHALQDKHEKLVLIDLVWETTNEDEQASVSVFSSYPSLITLPNSELLLYLKNYASVRLDNAPYPRRLWRRLPHNTHALSITCGSLSALSRILTALGVYCSLHDRRSEQGTQAYGLSDAGTLLNLKPTIIIALLVILHNHIDWYPRLPLHLVLATLLFGLLLLSPSQLDRGVVVYGLLTRNHQRRWSIDLSTFLPKDISQRFERAGIDLLLAGTSPTIVGTVCGVILALLPRASSNTRPVGLALLCAFEVLKNAWDATVKSAREAHPTVPHPARAVPGRAKVLLPTDALVDGHPGADACATRNHRTR